MCLNKHGEIKNRQKDYEIEAKHAMPIEWFDPKHEEELITLLRGKKDKFKERNHDTSPEERILKEIIEPVRSFLQEARGKMHAFVLTPEEQRITLRIFMEMCRYPEISSHVFKGSDNVFVSGYPMEGITKLCPTADKRSGGHFAKKRGIIASAGNNLGNVAEGIEWLARVVAEEMLHAYDGLKQIFTRMQIGDIATLSDWVKSLHEAQTFMHYVMKGERGGTEVPRTLPRGSHQREFLHKVTDAVISMEVTESPGRDWVDEMAGMRRAADILGEMVSALSAAAHFRTLDIYKELGTDGQQKEFFAKLAISILLTRDQFKNADPAYYDPVEKYTFSADKDELISSATAIFVVLGEEKKAYARAYTPDDRGAAERYANAVAQEVIRTAVDKPPRWSAKPAHPGR
ncbi:MAG: hypothetical protein EB060_06580 [Proteobacteria bacterium]|nr:hypothetical protein [Pseudomonadota bacterium]